MLVFLLKRCTEWCTVLCPFFELYSSAKYKFYLKFHYSLIKRDNVKNS